jgi:hypothetical protein
MQKVEAQVCLPLNFSARLFDISHMSAPECRRYAVPTRKARLRGFEPAADAAQNRVFALAAGFEPFSNDAALATHGLGGGRPMTAPGPAATIPAFVEVAPSAAVPVVEIDQASALIAVAPAAQRGAPLLLGTDARAPTESGAGLAGQRPTAWEATMSRSAGA